MIKLIASDIDGTLVPDGTDQIDKGIYDVIRRMKRHNIVFAGASGRQYVSMRKLFMPVMDDIYYITDNGSVLRDKNQVYTCHVIDRRELFEMIRDARRLEDCDIMLCGVDKAYCEEESEMFYWMKDSYKFDISVVGDFETNLHDDIVKMSIYHKDNAEAIVDEWFTKKWKDHFTIASAGIMWMDIVYPEATKGKTLMQLQEILGITREETMVFGDNLNDIEMLMAAEESYAIGSARQEVRDAAKHVALPLSESGVLKAITEYLDSEGLG